MQDGRVFLSSDNNLTFWLTIINMVNKTNNYQALKKENDDLKSQISVLTKEIRDWKALVENHQRQTEQQNSGASGFLKDMENSIEFVSEQYDGFQAFQKKASTRLKELSASLNTISKKVNDLAQAIDNLEAYSYQCNLKLVGIPELSDETATATANLCVKIFQKIGASVTINDIDIAHRVPKRSTRSEDERSSHNAIICKFTRRLPIQEIMQQRVRISTINPSEIGLPDDVLLGSARMFEHLTPKLQQLLYESKKCQQKLKLKFC